MRQIQQIRKTEQGSVTIMRTGFTDMRHAANLRKGRREHCQQARRGTQGDLCRLRCHQRQIASKLQAIALPLFRPQQDVFATERLAVLPARTGRGDGAPGQFRNPEARFMFSPTFGEVPAREQHMCTPHLGLRKVGMPAQGFFISGLSRLDPAHATQDVGPIEGDQGARLILGRVVGIAAQGLFMAIQPQQDIGMQGLVLQRGQREGRFDGGQGRMRLVQLAVQARQQHPLFDRPCALLQQPRLERIYPLQQDGTMRHTGFVIIGQQIEAGLVGSGRGRKIAGFLQQAGTLHEHGQEAGIESQGLIESGQGGGRLACTAARASKMDGARALSTGAAPTRLE